MQALISTPPRSAFPRRRTIQPDPDAARLWSQMERRPDAEAIRLKTLISGRRAVRVRGELGRGSGQQLEAGRRRAPGRKGQGLSERPARAAWLDQPGHAGALAPARRLVAETREGAGAGQRTYRVSRSENLIQRRLDTLDAERRLSNQQHQPVEHRSARERAPLPGIPLDREDLKLPQPRRRHDRFNR